MIKNKFKKWVIIGLCTILAILVVCSGIVIYVDPFSVYHKPVQGLYYPYDDVMYQAAGIVKNYEYSTLIAGTSLIQNMKASTAEELFGGKAVKTPLCGMSLYRTAQLIDLAAEHNPKLERVIVNMDREILLSDKEDDDQNFPEFLYDNNYFNDVGYLFNKSIILNKNIECIFNPDNMVQENFDLAFSSEKQFYFAEFAVKTHSIVKTDFDLQESESRLEKNIGLYKSLSQKYPHIKFDIVIPPKSIMSIKELQENGLIDSEITFLTRAVQSLLDCDNVEIHMIQDNQDIIGNLYNYCDFQHFSAKVSDYILQTIKDKTELLTKENYVEEILKVKTIAETFDYSVFDEKAYPIKGETDIDNYLKMLESNAKYEIYASYSDSDQINLKNSTKVLFESCELNADALLSGTEKGQFNQNGLDSKNSVVFGESGEIFINEIDYSMGLPGINIVVYDKHLERVIDSVNFNGTDLSECLRTKAVRKDK